jgi:hypothetical protein
LANLAKNSGPQVMAIFPIRRHAWSQFQALSGILRVAACLTRKRRHAE